MANLKVYLKPRSVQIPAQGEYVYVPFVKILEDITAVGLETLVNDALVEFVTLKTNPPSEYYVIEDIKYDVELTKLGPMPEMLYSAMIRGTQVVVV